MTSGEGMYDSRHRFKLFLFPKSKQAFLRYGGRSCQFLERRRSEGEILVNRRCCFHSVDGGSLGMVVVSARHRSLYKAIPQTEPQIGLTKRQPRGRAAERSNHGCGESDCRRICNAGQAFSA
jgi:hypothetical protein